MLLRIGGVSEGERYRPEQRSKVYASVTVPLRQVAGVWSRHETGEGCGELMLVQGTFKFLERIGQTDRAGYYRGTWRDADRPDATSAEAVMRVAQLPNDDEHCHVVVYGVEIED